MNFGVRLPGPFRVGVSSSGRVNAGVTMGPFSLSTQVTGGRQSDGSMFLPGWTTQAAAESLAYEGWKVSYVRTSLMASKGWTQLVIEPVRGGVRARRVTSNRTVWAWTIVVALVLGLCMLGAALS